MKIMKWSPFIVLLSAIILAGAILLAPSLQATAAPPLPQVEVAAPLPLPVAPVAPVLRDGSTIIASAVDPPYPNNYLEIPEGVALTDLMLQAIAGDDHPCEVGLFNSQQEELIRLNVWLTTNDIFGDEFPLGSNSYPSPRELHFESGLRSTVSRQLSLHLIASDCAVRVLWTGYEY